MQQDEWKTGHNHCYCSSAADWVESNTSWLLKAEGLVFNLVKSSRIREPPALMWWMWKEEGWTRNFLRLKTKYPHRQRGRDTSSIKRSTTFPINHVVQAQNDLSHWTHHFKYKKRTWQHGLCTQCCRNTTVSTPNGKSEFSKEPFNSTQPISEIPLSFNR